MRKRTIALVRSMVTERSIDMRSINSVMKLFSNGNSSPIEREVRRRLTWRIILLSLFPLPFLSLIIIWLCCLIQLNAGSIDTLLNQNCKITSRLCSIENELRKLTSMTNIFDSASGVTMGGARAELNVHAAY